MLFKHRKMLVIKERDKYPKLYSMAMMGEGLNFQEMAVSRLAAIKLMVVWKIKKCNRAEY